MDKMLYIGKITGIFGIKGEMKLLYEELHASEVLKKGLQIIINDEIYTISNIRNHKNNYLITLKDYEDINKIDKFLKQDVFIQRANVELVKDNYFYDDLFNCKIVENNTQVGVVNEVLYNKSGTLIKDNNLIIPLNEKYLEKIDIESKIIYVKDCKELML